MPGPPSLNTNITNEVKPFYFRENVSQIMQGKKDSFCCQSRRREARTQTEKKLILSNLKEAFEQFRSKNHQTMVGFSKCAEMRQQECVLASSSGTYSVCVCTLHNIVRLVMVGAKLSHLTECDEVPRQHYRHCLSKRQCNPPSLDYLLHKCKLCQFGEIFQEVLLNEFHRGLLMKLNAKCGPQLWSTLQIIHPLVDEFIQRSTNQQVILHDFIAKEQTLCYRDRDNSLGED